MKSHSYSFYLVALILMFLTSGCSLDASIQSLTELVDNFTEAKASTMAVSPSHQEESIAIVGPNQYRVRSTVGEITTGEGTADDGAKVYRAEINITYQKM